MKLAICNIAVYADVANITVRLVEGSAFGAFVDRRGGGGCCLYGWRKRAVRGKASGSLATAGNERSDGAAPSR